MNKIINNLPLITSALEHYDSKTWGAFKVRSTLTSMVVWAAHKLVKLGDKPLREPADQEPLDSRKTAGASPAEIAEMAIDSDDADRIAEARVVFATVRDWAREAEEGGFPLNLSRKAIRKTLNLDQDVDVREEALKLAREKCRRAYSAHRFEEFYHSSLQTLEEQRRVREAMIEDIENLIYSGAYADLYDREKNTEDVVQLQAERLEETVLMAVESAYNLARFELAKAVSPTKCERISADIAGLEKMLDVIGVKKTRFDQRMKVMEKAIDEEAAKLQAKITEIDKRIDSKIAESAIAA
jgi:hypothetical protein